MTDRYLRRLPDAVFREVAGESFLVPVKGRLADLQRMFVLNRVGAWVWERLDGATSREDLLAGIVAQFEVDAQTATVDLDGFLAELSEAGLTEGP